MKKYLRKLTAAAIIITMLLPANLQANATRNIQGKCSKTKEYLVLTKTKEKQETVNEKYKSLQSEYTEYSEQNNISINEMTEQEARQLENNKEIISVEENIEFKGCGEQIDPDEIVKDWNLDMINADNNIGTSTDEKVKIAIIDSGADECEGIEIKERYNLVPEEEGVLPIYDDFTGHGTAIAGIISGTASEGRDIKGINSNAELYSIKIMDADNTAPLGRVVEAIYKAIDYDVDIINMSFGTTQNSQILHQAVKDAYNEGILIVAAAGNRGESDGKAEYPAAYEEVMGVGAVDSNAQISDTSSYGDQVDVMAPGELIKTVANFGMETVSSGTSMAAPHVAGIASILWQKDKSKSPDFIRGLIQESANKINKNGEKYAIIDLEYALNKYEEYEKNYTKTSYEMEPNENDIYTSDEMERVTARWSQNNHETLVSNGNGGKLTTTQLNLVKEGIRYNDAIIKTDGEKDIWHALNTDTNYMSATYYVGKVIQDTNVNPANVAKTPGLTTAQYSQMKTDINKIGYTGDKKRLLLFGMSLHIITDAFAHRAWVRKPYLDGSDWNHWETIGTRYGTDAINDFPQRYKAAGQIVKNGFNLALNTSNIIKSYTIRSRHIMYNNTYFDKSFLLKDLVFLSETNKANDDTFDTWKKAMAQNTYTDNKSYQDRIPSF